MSRNITTFLGSLLSSPNTVSKKLSGGQRVGERLFPTKTPKNDEKHQLRLDAGPMIDGRYRRVHLQVNKEATSQGLKNWVQKHGSHADLSTGEFDTKAESPRKELERLCNDLAKEAKKRF